MVHVYKNKTKKHNKTNNLDNIHLYTSRLQHKLVHPYVPTGLLSPPESKNILKENPVTNFTSDSLIS